jgi:GTP-binding protein Era
VIAVNKVDAASRAQTVSALSAAAELGISEHVFPVSARTGKGVGELLQTLTNLLPPGPFYFEPRQHTDQQQSVLIAELVREQVLRRTREEVPHAVEVEVTDIEPRDGLVRIEAVLLTETESQKGILIGAGGRMVKAIGSGARRAIEQELDSRVHLELSVRTRHHWRADERLLDRLGIE